MKNNYNFDNSMIKDYSNEISDIEKFKIILNAFKATANISKEELKKEDFKRGTIKNISNQISIEDKIMYTLKAYLSSGQIFDKEKIKEQVNSILA